MSIVIMLNEKFREKVDAWQAFTNNPNMFGHFFHKVLEAILSEPQNDPQYMKEQISMLIFLNHVFSSMEVDICLNQAKRLVSLATWTCLQPSK